MTQRWLHSLTQLCPLVLGVSICIMSESTSWQLKPLLDLRYLVLSSEPRFSNLASWRHMGMYGTSQATCASPHAVANNQVEARELSTEAAAPAWEQSLKDPTEQPLAGSCRVAAGWVYELLAAVCDMSNEFLFLCVNVLWVILQCVWHFTV